MIYTVLRQRHMKEAVHLEDQLERERKAKIAQARSDVATKRAEERETLSTAFEQVWVIVIYRNIELCEIAVNSSPMFEQNLDIKFLNGLICKVIDIYSVGATRVFFDLLHISMVWPLISQSKNRIIPWWTFFGLMWIQHYDYWPNFRPIST